MDKIIRPFSAWYVYQCRNQNEANFFDVSAPTSVDNGMNELLEWMMNAIENNPMAEHRIIVRTDTVVFSTELLMDSEPA